MTFTHPLDALLGSRPKVALLRWLRRVGGSHTGRELARRIGADPKTVHAALRELGREGVVRHRRAGAAVLYEMNVRHAAVSGLLDPLFAREERLLDDYAGALRKRIGIPVVSLVVFGSVARGEERPDSDVDLLVVVRSAHDREAAQDMLDRAAVNLAAEYGNPPQVILFTRDELRRKALAGNPFLSEVLRTGRVLHGERLAELVKRGA